jgi:protein-L-isoaspartate(D-aspartate) O-methyltransferase
LQLEILKLNMNDTYKHKGLRKKLVETVRHKGIKDEAVLNALENIPRHLFMDSSFLEFAYQDKPFPIGSGQTISQPYTVAFQTELLDVKKGDKTLEVGTGSGYQACILAELGARVFTIERQKKLYQKTKDFLPTLGYRVKTFYGDGFAGLPAFQPFDKIIITAGAPYTPERLLDQLKIGGIMVIPEGKGDIQIMKRIIRISKTKYDTQNHGIFRFVPLLENKAND